MAEKAKNLLERIKLLFADGAMPTAYKLADGTDVTISLLDIGGDFSMNGTPAPEGTYTLADGTNVVVDSTGKITSVTDPSEFASTEYTLADGTKVSIDKMSAGGKVMQGEQAIANGTYTLEDGSKITVDAGLITVVTPKAAEAPAKMTREQVQSAYDVITSAAPDAQMGGIISCVKALMDYCFGWQIADPNYNPQEEVQDAQNIADAITAVQSMTVQFTSQASELDKVKLELQAQKDLTKQMLTLMTELAEAPSGDPPPQERKIRFSGEVQKTKKTSLERYAAAAEKLHAEHSEN